MLKIRTKSGAIYPLEIYGTDNKRHAFGAEWTELDESLVSEAMRANGQLEIEDACDPEPEVEPDPEPAADPEPVKQIRPTPRHHGRSK